MGDDWNEASRAVQFRYEYTSDCEGEKAWLFYIIWQ